MSANLESCLESLRKLIGEDNILTDSKTCSYYSQDVFKKGSLISAVVKPRSIEDLCDLIKTSIKSGIAVYPRGGGYSYTDSYLSTTPTGICIDLTHLNQITEINIEDMYVTAEAGCTWEQLDKALKPHDVRAQFWGPLSGHNATLGGGVSQGSASLGSAKEGMSAESVLGMDIITANGELFSTGSSAQKGKTPFFRNYGPDLTGLFCGDCGSLGIKARITLRLQKRARHVEGLSFSFESFDKMLKAMANIATSNRATECFGFTARAMESLMASQGFWNDLKIMFAVGQAADGYVGGIAQMIRMAISGRRFTQTAKFFAHCVVEANNPKELRGNLQTIRQAVGDLGNYCPNTMPTVMRAAPFSPYPVVGQNGTRMLPFHTILPFSAVLDFHNDLEKLYNRHSKEMTDLEMTMPAMFNTISTNGFLYEPVLYWPDKPELFHELNTTEELLEPMRKSKDNKEARSLATKLFREIVSLMHNHGGVHLQIGKAYPYLQDRSEHGVELIRSVKTKMDPENLINPGALGL